MSGPVGAEDHVGIYVINVIGATIRKLRDDALRAAVSPDGSRILFLSGHPASIMVMTADGEQARTVVPGEKGSWIMSPVWSPDGRRILFGRAHRTDGDPELTLESRDADGGTPVTVLADSNLRYYLWLPGNRLIYSLQEDSARREDLNLWELSLDSASGAPRGKPRKITDWSGFVFSKLSATSDGKQIVFVNDHDQGDIYVGELEKGGREMKTPQRLTLSDKNDWPGGWSADGKSILFYSNRSGNFDLYRQKVSERSADSIGATQEEKRTPQLSPDGKWIVYISWPRMPNEAQAPAGHIMRIPVGGGPAEPLFDVQGYATWGWPGDVMRNLGDIPGFRCASSPQSPCVLAEPDEQKKRIVFTPFDPSQGKKGQSISVESAADLTWAISPDGSRIATTTFDTKAAVVRIVPLDGSAPREIAVKGATELVSVVWAADGKSLFSIRNSSKGCILLHVDFNGDSQVLTRASWDAAFPTASPDGRYLAYGAVNSNSNVWIIPSLPKP